MKLLKLEGQCQTKPSDYHAVGMVIYEVLSGRAPFQQYPDQESMAAIAVNSPRTSLKKQKE